MQAPDESEAGPSRSRLPSPAPQKGTLSALWGQPTPGQLAFSKDDGKEEKKAPQRKRRKKDDVGQGRLVFGADGMSVATPPPPPVEEANGEEGEKKGRGRGKRKTEVATGDVAAKPSKPTTTGRKRGRPPKNAAPGPALPTAVPRLRVDLSPDSSIIDLASDPPDPDPEVIVMGSTPPASQLRRGQGTGLADDPVHVDDTPRPLPVKKKIVFAGDNNKPTHSFFCLRPSATTSAVASTAVSDAGSGAATPTTVTTTATATASGTQTPSVANGSAGKVHSFFSNGGRAANGTLKKGWGNCREGAEPIAPLPGGEWPNHLGTEPQYPASASKLYRRQVPPPAEVDVRDGFWENVLTRARSRSPPSPTTTPPAISAPPFILEHPAIAAVMSNSRPDDGRETWCERYRPREAASVLGNELEAEYLRDWLDALSIGQADARRVIRRVPRRKMANPELSWIVDDIGLFGEATDTFDDEDLPEPYEEPYLGPGQRPNAYPPLGAFVGNTIVLTGPSGSGKSAAVHAVATELGWDVFEVYPGIGKRTGPHLVNLVGNVGKNHMVGSREDKKKPAAAAAKAMFAKAKPKSKPMAPPMGSQGSASDPIDLEEDAGVEPYVVVIDGAPVEASVASKTKQSLILIDEADILFDEASSFWPTVVSLIAESRRPVVITCNDLATIPIDILPLQVILHFEAAPSYLAQPYLASIANKRGFSSDVARLFQDCSEPCLPDLVVQPLPPNGNEPETRFDLRAALTQMQLDRHSRSERRHHSSVLETNLGDLNLDLATLTRRMDAESYADAVVAPRPWARLETDEGDRCLPTNDDMDGIRQLCKPDVQSLHPTLAPYDAAGDIATSLVALSGGSMAPNLRQMQYDQTAYIRSLLPFLDPVVPLSARLLPHPSVFMDVVPWVRNMVLADDAFEMADRAAAAAGEARVNPRTGRAMRAGTQGYERWIDLGGEGRRAAVECGVWADVGADV